VIFRPLISDKTASSPGTWKKPKNSHETETEVVPYLASDMRLLSKETVTQYVHCFVHPTNGTSNGDIRPGRVGKTTSSVPFPSFTHLTNQKDEIGTLSLLYAILSRTEDQRLCAGVPTYPAPIPDLHTHPHRQPKSLKRISKVLFHKRLGEWSRGMISLSHLQRAF
jgi:hypothetical protein